MKKYCFFFLVLILAYNFVSAQNQEDNKPKFYLHSIADTAGNPERKEIVDFWINFLYEESDSVRRTYWKPSEIKRFGDDYALFYNSLFQYPPKALLNYFKPYILSIYLEDNIYHVVTAFWNFNFIPRDTSAKQNSNPFAILEIGIVKENNHLYLLNLFDKRVQNWNRINYGKITYIIEPPLSPDKLEMKQANVFVDSLTNIFSDDIDSITYVVCKTPQTLGYLLGFNFFFAGFTSGKTFINAKMIISGRGTFNYPHELTHIVLDPLLTPGHFLSEGLATFFGGSKEKTYSQLLEEFKSRYPIITDSTVDKIIVKPNLPVAYTFGALVVNAIYKNYGITGLVKLKASPNKANESLNHICKVFGLTRNQIYNLMNSILKDI